MKIGRLFLLCSVIFVSIFLVFGDLCLSADTGYTVEIITVEENHYFVNSFSCGGGGFCGKGPGTFFCNHDGDKIPFADVHVVKFTDWTRAADGAALDSLFRKAEITDLDGNRRIITLVLDNLNGVTDGGTWVLRHDRWDSIDEIVFARWGDEQ